MKLESLIIALLLASLALNIRQQVRADHLNKPITTLVSQ